MNGRGMIKELGKHKLSEEDRVLEKRMRCIKKAAKYHRTESQLVLWSYPKMLAAALLVPWKWRLSYYSATKSKATGMQMTLSERGKGKRKQNGEPYREVLHRSECRILGMEMGLMAASAELMGKGLAGNYAVRIVVRKRKK